MVDVPIVQDPGLSFLPAPIHDSSLPEMRIPTNSDGAPVRYALAKSSQISAMDSQLDFTEHIRASLHSRNST
ncbi:unnamed protein product [Protopolystoma xenopodis]|uniref:Uncharacterized protein n=1 Tax=Protopolystoma xenopodis TaxID=117903 RepID=A0A3S5FFV8_9PLAT|nr:unnamed protein product [Protopolystoma xenopodis]